MKIKVFALLLAMGTFAAIGLGQEKLTPDLWKLIDSESPNPLPQRPMVKRDTSDAFDEGLKGKVKRVISEYRSFDDVCKDRGRLLDNIDDYDLSGSQLRHVSFANCGRLIGIEVYGYIDGFRVGLYKRVGPSSGMFGMLGGPPPKPNPATQPSDKRYTYRYEYSYTEGKLTDMRIFYNDGRRGMYYKYLSSHKERSTSAFTYDDEHNWRSVSKLDDKGNEIERIHVDVLKVHGHDTVYRIHNKAFDQAGNWIQRSTYKLKDEAGKISETLVSEEVRTITYH